ncbi:MAG: aminotransferase class I/II-fold pyridoxal phosphate-dependent enzyme [Phormidium sp. PBR-2020]|nr:MAG: aminotransferase class I/II-fold pyridoxal phosphate-dependent enzyme [Phormidium sp. PBR-2020]
MSVYSNDYQPDNSNTFCSNLDLEFATLVDILEFRAREQPKQTAFTFLVDGEAETNTVNYEELNLRSKVIAAHLQKYASPGERALLLYPSSLEFIEAFLGCLYAKVIAIPVYPPKRNQKISRLEAIIDDSDAKVVLTLESRIGSIQKHFDKSPKLTQIACIATNKIKNEEVLSWKSPDFDLSTIAFLQYTSGSTGNPKGVVVDHANLLHNLNYIQTAFQLTSETVSVSWLPVFHDMGLIDGILEPIYTGFHGVLMSPETFVSKPIRWLKAISKYRATHCGSPNFGYALCLEKISSDERNSLDLGSWVTAYNGAELIRFEVLKRFAEFFKPCNFKFEFFYPCYGMAETTLMVSGGLVRDRPPCVTLQNDDLKQNRVVIAPANSTNSTNTSHFVGCGRAWLDTQIVIVDPETFKQVSSDRIGEIWVKSPSVARGYWNQPEKTKETFEAYLQDTKEGPFLRTGDLGFIKFNELFITGRIKDLIVIRGRNYYPQDIEFTVEKCHVSLRGNSGAAFAVEIDGEEKLIVIQEVKREYIRKIKIDEVKRHIRRAVSTEHEIQVYDIVLIKTASIAKTSSGKIQRSLCKQKYLASELSEIQTKSNSEQQQEIESSPKKLSENRMNSINVLEDPKLLENLESWMKQWIVQKTNSQMTVKDIPSDSQFVDYGLDSVQSIDFASELEKLLDVRLAEGTIFVYPTIRELSQHILYRLSNDYERLPEKLEILNSLHQVDVKDIKTTISDTAVTDTKFQSLETISKEYYSFDSLPEYIDFKERFSVFEANNLDYPYFKAKKKSIRANIVVRGRELIDFSSFDYLGMSIDPDVCQAAKSAIGEYGTSVSASRIVSGEISLHQQLERSIASWTGTEDAIVFGHGHATNVYAISSIVGQNDLILYDKCMHNSALMGGKLSSATMVAFPHNDLEALESTLKEQRLSYQRTLILVEGVYSMDGDVLANLPKLIEIKKRYKSWLFIDEAHSIGVIGKTGRGVGEYFGVDPSDVDVWMGTISKALGSSGGYIAGCQPLIDYLKHCSPGFLFSTGASPANVAAGLAAIQKVQTDSRSVRQLQNNSNLFLSLAKQEGLNTGNSQDSSVIPIIVGDSDRAAKLADLAFQEGINVFAIGYPAVEFNEARLRFFVSCLHTEEQIKYTVRTIAKLLKNL